MTRRTVLARVEIGKHELVVTLDAHDRLDIRLWTDTAGVKLASGNGLTLHINDVSKPIDALKDALRKETARQ